MQISVIDVSQISNSIISIQSIFQSLDQECTTKLQFLLHKVEECREELFFSNTLLDKAVEEERFRSLEYDEILNLYNEAKYELNEATSSEDLIWIAIASEKVEQIGYELQESSVKKEEAINYRIQMEYRVDLSNEAFIKINDLFENTQVEFQKSIQQVNLLIAQGISRLKKAESSLDLYNNQVQPSTDFSSWLNWTPSTQSYITPDQLNKRLNITSEQHKEFLKYLIIHDENFESMVLKYREALKNADNPIQKQAIHLKVKKNMSGIYSEKFVEHAFSAIAKKIDMQSITKFEDGKYTKTDLIIEDLKVPVILGRGQGMAAQIGGSIAVEIKTGQKEYLYAQKNHMVFQAAGHQNTTASMTITSRDIKDLSNEKEEELRKTLREAGSPLIGMLPRKDEIDKICWEVVIDEK